MSDETTTLTLNKYTAAGFLEGYSDYVEVLSGREDPTWAWPFHGADDAFLDAMTISELACLCKCTEEEWEAHRDEFLASYREGYETAHADQLAGMASGGDP